MRDMKELEEKRVEALIWWKYDLLRSEKKALTKIHHSGREYSSLKAEEIQKIHEYENAN
jgi:hypothetical protein|tara:strand:+ start:72 stop:248 length:177 start_codon:yes stop_codon:yes gene_type:complete